MSESVDYEFEWDDAKAESNLTKHGVDFMEAMSVFRDPLLMTRFDDEHRLPFDAGALDLGHAIHPARTRVVRARMNAANSGQHGKVKR